MKNTFLKLSILLFLFFISCTKNQEANFTIEGRISPVKIKYLLLKQNVDIEKKITKPIDTLYVDSDGNFKGAYNLGPHLYTLQLGAKKSIVLAIDSGQHVTVNVTDFDTDKYKITTTGSSDTKALLAYEAFRAKSLDSLVQSVRRKVKKIKESPHPDLNKIEALEKTEVLNYEKHLEELNAYIKKNMGTTIGLYATSIRWKGKQNFAFFDSITTAYEKAHPNLAITKKLREKVTRLQQTSVGGTALEINMNTIEDKKLSLASVNKKYTLIDFWASWCGPCRSESKVLNKLYKKYKAKGFEIYGVSLDDKKDKWLKAIEKDHRIWPNVSSLKGFKTKAAYNYAVTALPMNFLIDTDNNILGKNLHADELEVLLNKLMK
ncbi:MAG: TlpA disulfide reductase family protein [Flavobacteriaceae bacterium]